MPSRFFATFEFRRRKVLFSMCSSRIGMRGSGDMFAWILRQLVYLTTPALIIGYGMTEAAFAAAVAETFPY